MSFSTVLSNLTTGQVGKLATPIEPFNSARSYTLTSAQSDLKPGYGVVLDGDTVDLPSDANGIFAGVVFNDGSLVIESAAFSGQAGGNPNVPVLFHNGAVFVATSQATTPTDPVYLQFTAGSGAVGTFRKDADTSGSARAVLLTGCRWDVSMDSGIGCLVVNLPK